MLSDTIDPQCNTRALFRPIAAEIIMLLDTMSQCLTRYTYIFFLENCHNCISYLDKKRSAYGI